MTAIEIAIRPFRENDLTDADSVFRLAFGTFIGLPDPMTFGGDADYVRTRWLVDPIPEIRFLASIPHGDYSVRGFRRFKGT